MLLYVHRIQNESYYKGDEISEVCNIIDYNFNPITPFYVKEANSGAFFFILLFIKK